jgi:ABC-type nitrate/sulfonate/bicarbonate transport system permease component
MESTLQRVGVVMIGVLVLLWTIAVLAAMVFQCEMPSPWDVWTGKCIPLVSLERLHL